jgi:hypothetical protein
MMSTLLACPICGDEIIGAYAGGRVRRYCGRRCVIEAERLWHVLANRSFRRTALLAPTCRLPEVERIAALDQVQAEIADLECRVGVGP